MEEKEGYVVHKKHSIKYKEIFKNKLKSMRAVRRMLIALKKR
jgi:hypothetical protein